MAQSPQSHVGSHVLVVDAWHVGKQRDDCDGWRGKKNVLGKSTTNGRFFYSLGKWSNYGTMAGGYSQKKLLDLEFWPLQWWNLGQQPSTPSAPKKRFQKIKKSTKHGPTLPRSFQEVSKKFPEKSGHIHQPPSPPSPPSPPAPTFQGQRHSLHRRRTVRARGQMHHATSGTSTEQRQQLLSQQEMAQVVHLSKVMGLTLW